MLRFNQYELLMEVHHAIWSIVYHGRDTQTGREVAVKLKHDARHDVWTEHFEESNAIIALEHPNLVQVYDYGRSDDWYYRVTEWIRGASLSDRLQHGVLGAERTVNFMRQIAT